MLWIVTGILTSYLIGSIPTAYIFGKLLKGVDIRNSGSGNVGATNALRVLGKGPGVTVLFLDILKGFVVVIFLGDLLIAKNISISGQTIRILLGVSAILGHNWTVFLNFKGGKGIATTFGVLIGLSFKIFGLSLIVSLVILTWFIAFIILRIVSIASVIAGISLPLYMAVFRHIFRQADSLILLSILLCILVILRHKSNLKRAFQGKEPRLTFKKSV
jgi:glycerol-3-phosphate acyltransferase PlsY